MFGCLWDIVRVSALYSLRPQVAQAREPIACGPEGVPHLVGCVCPPPFTPCPRCLKGRAASL